MRFHIKVSKEGKARLAIAAPRFKERSFLLYAFGFALVLHVTAFFMFKITPLNLLTFQGPKMHARVESFPEEGSVSSGERSPPSSMRNIPLLPPHYRSAPLVELEEMDRFIGAEKLPLSQDVGFAYEREEIIKRLEAL